MTPRYPEIMATLSYVKRFQGTTLVLKLGGAILKDLERFESLAEDLKLLRTLGISIVLVHGGGPMINAELSARGISWEFVDGQRVTTPEMMDVIEMVLCGGVNRKIVRLLNRLGIPAVGISGTDASTLFCRTAPGKLGEVGIIEKVDPSVIHSILNTQHTRGGGAIPVIAPVGVGADGKSLNVNADWAASRIAQSLKAKKLLFLTDQVGILDGSGGRISELDAAELVGLMKERTIQGGMLTKANAILDAVQNGVGTVHVLNGNSPHVVIEELFTVCGAGTICHLRSRAEKRQEKVYAIQP